MSEPQLRSQAGAGGGSGAVRNIRRRPSGWGGVVAMAVACALVLLAVVTVWSTHPGPGRSGRTAESALPKSDPTPHRALPAADQDCDPTASLRPSDSVGPALKRIQDHKKLIVGVDQNSYLWGYRDPATGDIVGFDIDLAKAIAGDILGDPTAVTFKTVPTDQRIPAITSGDVDLVVRTMTITCDRLDQVAFSTVYFESGQQLLVPKDSGITSFNDALRGKRVCTGATSTGEAELKKNGHGAKIVTVPNQLDCLVRLQLGEVDAILTDSALAAGQAAQDPAVHLVGDELTQEPYGVAMNKNDTDLVRRVNRVLESYRAGGANSAWMRSFDKWLGKDMPRPANPPRAHYVD